MPVLDTHRLLIALTAVVLVVALSATLAAYQTLKAQEQLRRDLDELRAAYQGHTHPKPPARRSAPTEEES